MNERLKAFFAELAKEGVKIDERRMIASLSLSGEIVPGNTGNGESADGMSEDDNNFYVTFRALSATSFPWKYLYLDFSEADVLKKSRKLLKGQTVYSNHETRIENWKGVVAETRWDEPDSIPPGINARLKINKKWNEKEIDGIKEGAIHSVSADVLFIYKRSHPDLEDFWFMQGEEVNGEVVRLIITKIISYGELSLVWQGADGYAKRVGLSISGHNDTGSAPETKLKKKLIGGNNVKLSRSLALFFGLSLAKYGFGSDQSIELDESMQGEFMEDMRGAFQKMKEENTTYLETLNGLFGEQENPDYAKLTADIKEKAGKGDAYLNDIREEALKFAGLSEGDEKFEESPLGKAILNAGLDDALEFREKYRLKAEQKYPQKCVSCGGTLTRGSAHREGGDQEVEEVNPDGYEF